MKKTLLLLLGIVSFASVNANDIGTSTETTTISSRYNDAVTFIEKGVQFHVFLNGDFEFDKPNRNRTFNGYNNRRYNRNNIRIDRDYEGKIKRIGTNYIRYDYKGNVIRIGNIRIYYNRGFVKRVGNLKVSYNTWGEPYFYGNVHRDYYDSGIQFSLNFGSIFNYNDHYFYDYSFKNNYRKYREDKYYYYYKVRPNGKVGKRRKRIKRRKSGVINQRNNDYTKRKNTPYRKTTVKRKTYDNNRRTPNTRIKTTKKSVKRRAPNTRVKKGVNKRKIDKKQERRRRS